jgi:hypothetical protein
VKAGGQRRAGKPTREAEVRETVELSPDVFEAVVAALSDALLADLLAFPLNSDSMGGSPSGTDHDRNEAA